MPSYRYPRRQLLLALVTGAMDFLHLGLVYPLFTELVAAGGGLLGADVTPWQRSVAYSALVAAFPLGQFFGATWLGRLSDRYGRRKILLLTVFGSACGMALCGWGVLHLSVTVIVAGRLLGGVMGANLALAYATIVDMSTPEAKVKNLALVPLATSTGFTLGPLLTATVHAFAVNPVAPFVLAAVLSVLNWLGVLFCFEEGADRTAGAPPKRELLLSDTSLYLPLVVVFLMIAANFLLVQFAGPLAAARFGWGLTAVSWMYVNMSVTVAFGHLFLTRKLAERLAPTTVLPWALAALAVTLAAVAAAREGIALHLIVSLAMVCCAVAYTNVLAYLSDHASDEQQGEVMGLGVTVQCLAEWLPPLCVGCVAAATPAMPMLVGAGAAVLALMLFTSRSLKLINS